MPNPLDGIPFIEVQNQNAAQIPGYGIMRVTDISVVETGRVVAKVDQPNVLGDTGSCLVNLSPTPIGGVNGGANYGVATRFGFVTASYNTGDGTPAYGDQWGPQNGQWTLRKFYPGYFCLGAPTNSTQGFALFRAMPFLAFRGVTVGSINSGAVGTVSIYYRSDSATYTIVPSYGGSQSVATVYNGLDAAVSGGKNVWCKFQPYTSSGVYSEGWIITQADC